ncbi:tetratricopeptide repeat protein [Shewanella sp. NIFS-20-20]|uniref:tetratricopeptide repeat protein n=1 Tax=Shewanella sp. NIFS-20-20 TaxID=2853806 RepID=UPI001C44D25C|nr:tetratricopeptide repeat protein [Shewanella sp. NIFS-20-20]MBV7315734.1 tetratricopeptide repeat protein [Shewanella sp. NIFS-20-20]
MDLRLLLILGVCVCSQVMAARSDDLTSLATLAFEHPLSSQQALDQMDASRLSHQQQLRLTLLQCETLLQTNANQAAINLARRAKAEASLWNIQAAIPYFLNCMSSAYFNRHDKATAFSLLDQAMQMAHESKQTDALIYSLLLRGQLQLQQGLLMGATEDLRLALNSHENIDRQANDWIRVPAAYLQITLAQLYYTSHDHIQALHNIQLAMTTAKADNKVRHQVLLSAARLYLDMELVAQSQQSLQQAKALLPYLASPFELAASYSEIASIEMSSGHMLAAIELLELALTAFTQEDQAIDTLKAASLLAQAYLFDGQTTRAIPMLEQAIAQANQLQQYADVERLQHLLAEHFSANGQTDSAYAALQAAYFALQQQQHQLSKMHFSHSHQLPPPTPAANTLSSPWNFVTPYLLVALLFFVIVPMIWVGSQRQKVFSTGSQLPTLASNNSLKQLLSVAKLKQQPLSIILLTVPEQAQLSADDLNSLLVSRLRQQDELISFDDGRTVIVLPNTHTEAAKRVRFQVKFALEAVNVDISWHLGMASMQHFDTPESIIKRAGINQLSYQCNRQATG